MRTAGLSEGPARRLGAEFQLGCAAALRRSRLLRALESGALFVGPEAEPGPAPGCSPRQPIGPGLVDRPPTRCPHACSMSPSYCMTPLSCTCVTNDVDLLEGMPTGASIAVGLAEIDAFTGVTVTAAPAVDFAYRNCSDLQKQAKKTARNKTQRRGPRQPSDEN